MNRVNVEVKAFIDAPIVDEAMEWEEGAALGKLCMIWGFSQSKAITEASPSDICRWGRVRSPECQARFIEALKEAGFLIARADGLYEISGNDTQIKNLANTRKGNIKGGEVTRERWLKWREEKALKESDSSTHARPIGRPLTPPGPIQCSSKQCSSKQNKKNEEQDKDVCTAPENSGALPATEPDPGQLPGMGLGIVPVKAIEPTIAEFSEPPEVAKTLKMRRVSLEAQKAWIVAYPDQSWIKQEILKAIAWEEVNPARRKKHFARFMGRWLSRGWDSRKIGMPLAASNRAEARSQGNLASLAAYQARLAGAKP